MNRYHKKMGKGRIVCMLLAVSVAAWGQPTRSVSDLVGFIKSCIQQHEDDKKVAEQVQRIRLANRLDPSTVEDLRRQGAGPRTVAALQKLAETSAALPAAPAVTAPAAVPPPTAAEEQEILAQIRKNALSYSESLPNYICTQVTTRRVDPTGTGDWHLEDTITEQLTFFDQKENYNVILINNSPVTKKMSHDQLPGARSTGEFGTLLREIFDPLSETRFEWDHWNTARNGTRQYVFAFIVEQHLYGIHHDGSQRSIRVGYHGWIYADQKTRTIRRIKMECDGIPVDFPIQKVSVDLVYEMAEISGQEFVLPAQADIRSSLGPYASWNQTTYHGYHKYGADASISFENPDDPAKPPAKKK